MRRGVAGILARGLGVALGVGALALSVAGCATDGRHAGAAPGGAGASVAFESIDGPPPEVFKTLVARLNEEANARQVPVVTREGYARYRVRGYVAASVVKKQTVLSWVWDVYDGETRRAARLAGEEKAGAAGRDAWSAANDAVLARIARSGMEQLAAFLNAPAVAPQAPAEPPAGPGDGQPAVASTDMGRPAPERVAAALTR
jgi:hypothetical protein